MKLPCQAQSQHLTRDGMVYSGAWRFPCNMKRQPDQSTGLWKTFLRRNCVTCKPKPHLKLGRQTVAELGPEKLGDLDPGQRVYSSLSVDDEPDLTEIVFNGYVIHMEVFDCDGPGPIAHTGGEGAEGGSESGEVAASTVVVKVMLNMKVDKRMKTRPDQYAIQRRFRPGSSQ